MAWVRIYETGFEDNYIDELQPYPTTTYGSTTQAISSTKKDTGTYSLRCGNTTMKPRGIAFSSQTELQYTCFFNHLGLNTTSKKGVLTLITSSFATPTEIYYDNALDQLILTVNGSTVDTITASTSDFASTDVWHQLNIYYLASATVGEISVYLNGVEILNYSGNTGTGLTAVYLGGEKAAGSWANYIYFDNLTMEYGSGSEGNAPMNGPKYLPVTVTANGYNNDWDVFVGPSNYQDVDDGTPDDDTTYIYTAVDNEIDAYDASTVNVPAGYGVTALIVRGYIKKTDAGTDHEIYLGSRLSSTNSFGTAQNLTTSYAFYRERQTTKPGGGSWTESDINSIELLAQSESGTV